MITKQTVTSGGILALGWILKQQHGVQKSEDLVLVAFAIHCWVCNFKKSSCPH